MAAAKKIGKVTFEKSGKATALQGIKASYDAATKSYSKKATLNVSVKWYVATSKKCERVVFNSGAMAVVCTRMQNGKIRLEEKALNLVRYDEDLAKVKEEMNTQGFKSLKGYLVKKYNLNDMNWDTLVKKIGAVAAVENEKKEN